MMMFKALVLASAMIFLAPYAKAEVNNQICDKAIGYLFRGIETPRRTILTDDKGATNQTIFVDGKMYANYQGKWSSFDFDPIQQIIDAKESLKFARPDCRYVGMELFKNVDTTVYEIITHEDTHEIYHKVWVNSVGLPIELHIDDYEQDRKVHSTQSFDYNNVKAPF